VVVLPRDLLEKWGAVLRLYLYSKSVGFMEVMETVGTPSECDVTHLGEDEVGPTGQRATLTAGGFSTVPGAHLGAGGFTSTIRGLHLRRSWSYRCRSRRGAALGPRSAIVVRWGWCG